jgi:HK97 family phage major capsid protein
MDRIKQLYQEAGELHKQGTDILKEYEGKDLPAEKYTQVQKLFDDAQAKSDQAKDLERQEDIRKRAGAMERDFNTPQNRLGAGTIDTTVKESEVAIEYKAAYTRFLKVGLNRLNSAEVKALSAGDDQAGGYITIPDQHRTELITKQRVVSAMRQIARVLPAIPGGSSITPSQENDLSDAVWTTEVKAVSFDTVSPFGRRVLTPHPLSKGIKVSRTLMRSAMFSIDAWVTDQFAYKFGVPEENAFINGTGAAQPLGLLNTASLPVFTTAASTTVTADDVINWIYSLPARYAAGARILCNRAFIRRARLLKGTDNNYLWQPGLQGGSPSAILDTPYVFSDQYDDGLSGADAWEANAVVAVIGDYSYYWIVDSLDMSIQRVDELYAETDQVGFIGRKATDGMAVLAEAFYGLKIKS